MSNRLLHTLIGLIAALALVGCDVHEMPDAPVSTGAKNVVLHLNFDTEMPPYKEIIYETGGRAPFPDDRMDLRYTVHLYNRAGRTRSIEDRAPDSVIIVTKSGSQNINHNVNMNIPHGDYSIMVWTDYVESGSVDDHHYDTNFFYGITIQGDTHSGNDDTRDAFRGFTDEHIDESHSGHISITMTRPLAKYKFISTDLEEFLSREEASARAEIAARGEDSKGPDDESKGEDDTRYPDVNINLDDYHILFRYSGFMPHVYNMFTDKPSDARTGVTFPGHIVKISDTEAELGYDYVFVNGQDALVTVAVEIYNKKNELIGASRPTNVELKRSTLTRVRGEFLTSRSSGGVGIKPDFEDDINIFYP